MKYYKLLMDYNGTKEDLMVCYVEEGFSAKYGIDEYAIYEGKIIDNWSDKITFYYNPSEGNIPNDYLATDLGWLIVSERCKVILDELNVTNVQYLPIKIQSQYDDSEINDFYVVNIIGQVEALNLEASVYTFFELDEEKILSVIKYGLNRVAITELNIFRIKESKFSVFISEKVKDVLIVNKLSGFDFLEVRVV